MKKLTVDWEGLRIFAVFVEAGSFSGAARLLGLTHATVSRRLQALEAQFGGALYVRRGDEVELSPLGQTVLDTAQEMQEQSARLERNLAARETRVHGVVRVATTEAMGAMFLAPRLSRLFEQWPGLTIEFATNNHAVSLARRDADIAIRFARPEAGDLIAKRLGDIPYFVAGTEALLAGAGEADTSSAFITYDDGVPEIPETRWTDRHIARERVRFRSNSLTAQWMAAQAGIGLALLPEYLVRNNLRAANDTPALYREAWMVFHRDVRNVARLRAVMGWLEECFAPGSGH